MNISIIDIKYKLINITLEKTRGRLLQSDGSNDSFCRTKTAKDFQQVWKLALYKTCSYFNAKKYYLKFLLVLKQ